MEEQELVRVNLQLPASALESLSRLAEQMRMLAAAVNGLRTSSSGAPEETAESGFFDPERFQALQQRAEVAAGKAPQEKTVEATAVRAEVPEYIQDPEGAGWEPAERPGLPEQEDAFAGEPGGQEERAAQGTGDAAEEAPEVIPTACPGMSRDQTEIPTNRPETDGDTPEIPAVRMEPDSRIPEAEKIWTQSEETDLPLPASQADIPEGAETLVGAGTVVTAQVEPPISRWASMTEELVTAGPAPMTAEAVSLAFQRDGRRYDNGFPLY